MSEIRDSLMNLGVKVPEALLPSPGVDPGKWAVVACDQYSSEREYWGEVAKRVGSAPSTLRLIYPECYLEDGDKNERIAKIQASMREYLAKGYLTSRGEGFILVERSTPYEQKPRVGLMVAVDLERYRYGKDSTSLIRPTEGTIVERLPPRMAIRRGAPMELPHIMILMDDPERSVIEPLYARRTYFSKLYDFDLMNESGHLRGWHVRADEDLERIAAALGRLADPEVFKARYGKSEVLLFAVGDGNHSLATAKAVWEEIKASLAGRPDAEQQLASHPARFALVELLNIYDEGLPFHPIHRVLFGVDEKKFLDALKAAGAALAHLPDAGAAFRECDAPDPAGAHRFAFVSARGAGLAVFHNPTAKLAAATIQTVLDEYLAKNGGEIDYIHGSGSLEALAVKPGNIGLYLPPVDKSSFFATVVRDGVMPRKTFSMGEAPEKRFYVEARSITP